MIGSLAVWCRGLFGLIGFVVLVGGLLHCLVLIDLVVGFSLQLRGGVLDFVLMLVALVLLWLRLRFRLVGVTVWGWF